MIEDAAVAGAGDGPQLDAAVFDLKRLDLLCAVRGQAVLEVDVGERGRELPEVGRWRRTRPASWPKLQ